MRAAAAIAATLRGHREAIEQEQRLPPSLVREMRAAGLYSLVMPAGLGGGQADPLTYTRAVEVLAEGLGSVG